MFAMTDLDGTGIGVLWFHCGAERFHELLEREGIIPSPHLARAHWVSVERWDILRPREIEDELKRAHALIFDKLPARTKAVLALPEKDRIKAIRERKKALAARTKAHGSGTTKKKAR
jgi:predicted DNA-binding protein (MmcQ/YjbR family)